MLKNFLDVTFSKKTCLECGKQGEQYICSSCLLKSKLNFNIINIYRKDYKYLVYLGKYKDDIRQKILKFKFYNETYMGEYFLSFLSKNYKLCEFLKKFDLIIPIPMYKTKKCIRGYNQSELLAESLNKKLGIKYSKDILIKIKENKMQSSLNKKERIQNVKNIFNISNKSVVARKNIILVDDIFTTGATMNENAKLLKSAGAINICAFVIARV